MQIAQRLFQGVEIGRGEMEGLITYHRTDSTTLSEKALTESARVITEMFGPEYYAGPRRYATKVKNAQEAHEAIRPTDFRLAPQQLAGILDADDLRLYELIWKRTMASQMVDARVQKTTLEFTVHDRVGTGRVHREREDDRVRRVPPRVRRGQRRSAGGARGSGNAAAGGARGRSRARRRRLRARSAAARRRSRSGTKRCRRRASPKPRSSRSSSRRASAGRPPTPRSSRPSSGASTCSGRARRSSRASRRLRSPSCCAATSPTTSTSGSPRRWRRRSTRSRTASRAGSSSSAASTAATASTRASRGSPARRRTSTTR